MPCSIPEFESSLSQYAHGEELDKFESLTLQINELALEKSFLLERLAKARKQRHALRDKWKKRKKQEIKNANRRFVEGTREDPREL